MRLSHVEWTLLALSAALAVGYGAVSPGWYEAGVSSALLATLKASGVVLLALVAFARGSRLLGAGLAFGALGDVLLALGQETFLAGAVAFLIGHFCYIALFLRAGIGDRGVLREPARVAAMLIVLVAAVVMTSVLVPRDSALYAALGVYTGVLTIMTMSSFTLPTARALAMLGAVLFFISDGFVAWNMFHPDPDATSAFWRSFAGWMIYWAGQTGICLGMLRAAQK